jgi:hypothetical protein
MGGSSNIYKNLIGWSYYVVDGLDFIDDKSKESFYKLLEEEVYVNKVKKYDSVRQHIAAGIPIAPSNITRDFFNLIDDIVVVSNAVSGAGWDKDKSARVARILFTPIKYGLPNPGNSLIDRAIKDQLRVAKGKEFKPIQDMTPKEKKEYMDWYKKELQKQSGSKNQETKKRKIKAVRIEK